MAKRFDGKVALVTGGGSGIGRSASLYFGRDGASVVVVDVNLEGAQETVKQLEKVGAKGLAVRCDISKPADAEKMVKEAQLKFGRLDIAVNNAGIGGPQVPLAELSVEDWRKVMSINLDGVFYGMKYEIPAMVAAGGGVIVNTSSILGLVGFPAAGAYTATKHAVMGLTKVAAMEYGPKNIRVVAMNPGFIETPLTASAITPGDDAYKFIASKSVFNRWGKPDEIGAAIAWACSPEASFMTGVSFCVDGGYTAQ